jgi:tetratricopeptide (TPR) repeat protein
LEKHCEYFMMFLQEREDRLNRDLKAVEEIRAELEDLHAAWLWALSENRLDLIEMGSACLAKFYRLAGLLKEGEAAFDLAVERVSSQPLPEWRSLLVGLLVGQAGLLNDRARHADAIEAARRAVELAESLYDVGNEAAGYLEWGQGLWRQSDLTGSKVLLQKAIKLSRLANSPQFEAGSQVTLGLIHNSQGRISEALTCFVGALLLYQEMGDRHGESGALNRLGTAYYTQGNLRGADAYYEKALQIFLEFGDRHGEGRSLNNLGVVAMGLGDLYRAKDYFEQTLPITRESGDRGGESAALSNLGVVLHRLGAFDQARIYYERGLQLCREIGEWVGELSNLSNLGLLAYHQDELDTALEIQQNVLHKTQQGENPEIQSMVWMRLGRVLADREILLDASEAYRKSMTLRRELGRINPTLEPMAGMVRVSMAMGELDRARAMVEDILTALDLPFSSLMDSTDDPYWVYLSCVLVLRADRDPRALEILRQAYKTLQSQASLIGDESLRNSFLENLPGNQALLKEWERETANSNEA